MSRRMTVVFHDEELYTSLKVEAARRHKPASNIITEAVRQWLEKHEDAKQLPKTALTAKQSQAKDTLREATVKRTAER